MMTKIAACLLALSLLAACETTKTTQRTTLREMNNARLASADTSGPEEIPGEGPRDPVRNPALVPTPLIRVNAAGGL